MPFPDPIHAISELQRLLHNIVRVGAIHSVDHGGPGKPALVRVKVGELLTDWCPYHESRAGGTSTWSPPTEGEQVTVLSPGGDLGAAVVIVGLNSTGQPAPSNNPGKTVTRYADGAEIEYDHTTHALRATLPDGGTAELVAPAGVTIDTKLAIFTGDCLIKKTLIYQGGMLGSGKAEGASSTAEIQGVIRVTEDVIAGGVSVASHAHDRVQRGNDSSGKPIGGAA